MEKTVQPYELLVRFKDGKLSGAHLIDLECFKEGGVTQFEKRTPAREISVKSEKYSQLLSQVNLDLVDECKEHREAIESLQADRATLEQEKAVFESQVKSLSAEKEEGEKSFKVKIAEINLEMAELKEKLMHLKEEK